MVKEKTRGESEIDTEERIERLRKFDLEVVNKQLRADGMEEVEKYEKQFRRMCKYILENPDGTVFPEGKLDEYWHKFILTTRLYHEFCDQVFGYYLHHEPQIPNEE